MIKVIMAHDSFWGIGRDGELPWPKNSGDLKWFKETTLGCTVVMGRGTWEGGMPKPLPNRRNIVITNNPIAGVECYTLEQFKSVYNTIEGPIYIIGGAALVKSCLSMIDQLLLNNVGNVYDCDTFLPKQDITKDFVVTNTEVTDFGIISTWSRRPI